jgi:PAS domain S-box-containing protein
MDISGTRVLIVDDEPAIAYLETLTLKEVGAVADSVRSGQGAIEAVLEEPGYDLVLMDIDLGPGMDGTAAARRILAERDIPLIFLSGHTEPELVARTEDITSYGYVVKNSGPTVLISSIKMALKLHQLKQDLIRQVSESRHLGDRLRRLVESVPAAVALFDRDMRYLAVSRQFAGDYGVEGNLMGKSHYDVFPDLPERWKAIHRRGLAGETVSAELDEFPRANGTVDYVRWTIEPWYEIDGSVGGILLFSLVVNRLLDAYRAGAGPDRTVSP